MRLSLAKFTLVFLLLCSLTAVAQEYEEEERDILEFSVFGGGAFPGNSIKNWQDTLGAKSGFDLGFDFGYFLTPDLVLGLNFTYAQFAIDTDNEAKSLHHRLYNPALYLKYYFFIENSNFAPYVKGHVGVDNPKFTTFIGNVGLPRYRELSYDPAFAFGGGVGLLYYTSYYSGLFVEVNYHRALSKDVTKTYEGETYKFGENISLIDVHAGISVFFGS